MYWSQQQQVPYFHQSRRRIQEGHFFLCTSLKPRGSGLKPPHTLLQTWTPSLGHEPKVQLRLPSRCAREDSPAQSRRNILLLCFNTTTFSRDTYTPAAGEEREAGWKSFFCPSPVRKHNFSIKAVGKFQPGVSDFTRKWILPESPLREKHKHLSERCFTVSTGWCLIHCCLSASLIFLVHCKADLLGSARHKNYITQGSCGHINHAQAGENA